MKTQANQHRTNRTPEPGDWVFVKLQHYKEHSVVHRGNQKLFVKFFGLFQVIAKIRVVAYKLQLPVEYKIRPVFHISQLRKQVGPMPIESTLPTMNEQGHLVVEPIIVLDRKGHRAVVYVLIQWSHTPKEDAT